MGLDAQALKAFQLMPYTKSNTQFSSPVYTTSFSVVANKDKWAEISPEDQQAILAVSGPVLGAQFGTSWDAQNASAEAAYTEEGIEVLQADAAFEQALRDGSTFVTEKWLKDAAAAGIDAEGALAFYKARVAELTAK